MIYKFKDMIDFLGKTGILGIPIFICSILAFAIFLERIIRFSRLKIRAHGLVEKISMLIKEGNDQQAYELANSSNTPLGRILAHAMDVKDQDPDTLETVIVHATDEEIRGLSRYLQALATIGNIAPLLGLLGTVFGMIKAFWVIQQLGGKVNASVLAGGIWEALLTTALGLSVALPILVAHSYLTARVDTYEAQIQDGTVVFLKALSTRFSRR